MKQVQQFLSKSITLRQAVILNILFETVKARGIVKALGNKAFIEGAPQLSPEAISFDFTHYPHLWDEYESIPEEIRDLFTPYVMQLVPDENV